MATSVMSDLRTLWHLTVGRVRGESHSERLESFYRPQAEYYDAFRARMLHGRDELFRLIPFPPDATWIDMGAGTGENVERIGDNQRKLSRIQLIDLSDSLLAVARQRAERNRWENVEIQNCDVTRFEAEPESADVVTFSYSLTMIPDWFRALEHAKTLLRPGGLIGIVDFYVSRKFPDEERIRHSWLTRSFWPAWFASDNVFLSPDHLPWLQSHFQATSVIERRGSLPWVPFCRVPYYLFLGRKPLHTSPG